jgi:hypothetical protein
MHRVMMITAMRIRIGKGSDKGFGGDGDVLSRGGSGEPDAILTCTSGSSG